MKKVLFLLVVACLLMTSCGKSGNNAFVETVKEESKESESSVAESSVEESSVEESSVEESSVEESSVEESVAEEESSVEESSTEEPAQEEPAATEETFAFSGATVSQDYYDLQYEVLADWNKQGEATDMSIFYYGDTTMLQLSSTETVVPNLLDSEVKNEFIEGFSSAFETFEFENITDIKIDGRDAFRYEFNGTASNQTFVGDSVLFQSDSRMYVFVMYNLDATTGREAYINDFNAVLGTIKIGAAAETTASAETSDSWNTKYEAGEYVGGDTIPAGEYVFFMNPNSIAGVVMISTNGDFNDYENIVFSEIINSSVITSIEDGEYVQLNYCYAVPIEEVDELPLDVKSGWYKVGKNLPAGTYKLEPSVDENTSIYYYFIYKDNRKEDLVSYGDVSEGATIEVNDGEYLVLSCCHIVQ